MSRGTLTLTLGLAAAVAVAGWLYRDNAQLRERLRAARAAGEPAVVTGAAVDPWSGQDSAVSAASEDGARAVREPVARPRPELPEPREESRAERRIRRQAELAALLGRLDGETEEEYRARMAPFVETTLAPFRSRVEEARREMEEKAGVTDEQRAQLDEAIGDAFDEMLALTNDAIANGDLTPYERNWSGAMSWVGGLGAVLGSAENRIGGILTPAQQQILYDSGFEWGEYLGVSTPWEQLNPPPAR